MSESELRLYRVVTPKGICGVVVIDGIIRQTAPLLEWARNRPLVDLKHWVSRNPERSIKEVVDG